MPMTLTAVCLTLRDLQRPPPRAGGKRVRIILDHCPASYTPNPICHQILLVLPSKQVQKATTASPLSRPPPSPVSPCFHPHSLHSVIRCGFLPRHTTDFIPPLLKALQGFPVSQSTPEVLTLTQETLPALAPRPLCTYVLYPPTSPR